jgi:hypothetical protein
MLTAIMYECLCWWLGGFWFCATEGKHISNVFSVTPGAKNVDQQLLVPSE